jgi:hypothetical protein
VFLTGHRIANWLAEALRLGMTPQGRGDHELVLHFDPADADQAAWLIKTVGAGKKRQVSEAQREASAARMAARWSSRQSEVVV